MEKKIFKNAFIYTLAEVINKAVPFLLLPILTRYLTPSDFGVLATFTTFLSVLTVFVGLNMASAISISFFKMSKDRLKIYIANTLFIILVSTIFFLLIMLLGGQFLAEKIEVPFYWLIVSVFLALAQSITAINLALWHANQQPVPYGTYQILLTLMNLVISIVLIIGFGMGLEGRFIGLVASTLFFLLTSLIIFYKSGYLTFSLNKNDLGDAIKFGVPLIPHTLSSWVLTGIDRLYITMLVGLSATGLYSVGYQFGMIIGIIASAFNQAYGPYVFKKLNNINLQEKEKIVKFTYIYYVVVLLAAGVFSFVLPYIMVNFLGNKFSEASQFVTWISFGYAFQGMYFMVVIYIFYMKKTHLLAMVTFSVSMTHAVISYALIKFNGVIGAAQATTISYFILFVVVWVLSIKIYSMPWLLNNKRAIL